MLEHSTYSTCTLRRLLVVRAQDCAGLFPFCLGLTKTAGVRHQQSTSSFSDTTGSKQPSNLPSFPLQRLPDLNLPLPPSLPSPTATGRVNQSTSPHLHLTLRYQTFPASDHVNTLLLGTTLPLHALCGAPIPSAILVRHDRGPRAAHILWGCMG